MAYATVADLQAYMLATPPPEGQRMLARASDLLDTYLNTAVYTTDVNGNPTDTSIIAAFKDAVCAQVEWWAAGNDPLAGMMAPRAVDRLEIEKLLRYVGDY